MTSMRIPLSAPDITEAEIEAVVHVLRTPQLSLGPKLEAFECATADYVGVAHAVAVNSGTSGLHLCVRCLDIREGDEVIVPSFTFIAAANVIRMERATPVFVDIDASTLNLDPQKVEAAITSRTRAILVVHTFGRPADMTALLAIAKRHGLRIIEDACEAIGAEERGRKVGAIGDAGVFAFYPNKQITTGEGGIIVTNDAALAAMARALRNQGRGNPGEWLEHSMVGYNYRLSEMQCALGLEQLSRLESILARRAVVAAMYDQQLRGNPDLMLPELHIPEGRISWFVYVVRLSGRFQRHHRDAIVAALRQQGIGCGQYFAPIHLQPAYQDLPKSKDPLTVTEHIGARSIALPFFNRISAAQVSEVCEALQAAIRAVSI
ncbi:MAG TPA: DegT/DnrJ/EryC1/StrS family aminotransferase [Acidobacteriaceae bacterium]|nr:DegT/DnrJ/EryC1/StrS family aminotransferase [Acidobacteriaceae bacterium]